MNCNKKIKAFTLMEMLMVIVISAIVVGIAFTVLNLVRHSYSSIRQNYQVSLDVLQMKQRFSIDFNRYHNITYKSHLNEMYLRNPIDSTTYLFTNSRILRNNDTLPLLVEHVIFFFDGNIVENGKVDAMQLFFKHPAEFDFFIYKLNDSKIYMTDSGNQD